MLEYVKVLYTSIKMPNRTFLFLVYGMIYISPFMPSNIHPVPSTRSGQYSIPPLVIRRVGVGGSPVLVVHRDVIPDIIIPQTSPSIHHVISTVLLNISSVLRVF